MIWSAVTKQMTDSLVEKKIAVEIPNFCIVLATDPYRNYRDPLEKTTYRISQTLSEFDESSTGTIRVVFNDDFLRSAQVLAD